MTPWKTVSREEILRMGRYLTVEKHAVQLANGTVIPDWSWVITPDFVTVAALTVTQRFICFRQTKYAVEGTSLAPVGGFIEPGETPLQAYPVLERAVPKGGWGVVEWGA